MTGPLAAAELARLLAAEQDISFEIGDTTAILEAIAGERLAAAVHSVPGRCLDDREEALLRPRPRDVPCRRQGILRTASGIPAADVTAVILPRRLPGPARAALGVTPAGAEIAARRGAPLSRALRGFGVRRRQLEAVPGDGRPAALRSVALLLTHLPVALVTETVYAEFLAAFPPPWPGLRAAAHLAGGVQCQHCKGRQTGERRQRPLPVRPAPSRPGKPAGFPLSAPGISV